MKYLKSIGVISLLLSASFFIYSSFIHADISFEQKSNDVEIVQKVKNPVNSVTSGSIVYLYPNKTTFTQIALNTEVDMSISGTINRVSVKQTFTNPSNDYVDGTYVFPLPENSAVDQLKMYVGQRIIEGQIHKRKEAKKIYEQAKKDGKKTTLVEQQRPNMFTTRIANIAPGESVTVEISYLQSVLIDNDKFSIRFPLTIGERYIPGESIKTSHNSKGQRSNTHKVKDASEITPPIESDVDRPVSININFSPGFDVDTVKSSYHQIDIKDLGASSKHISLGKSYQANRDFELAWKANPTLSPNLALFAESKGDNHYLMLMATPPKHNSVNTVKTPREVIFIIDSSGSMTGYSMEQAVRALTQAINRLTPNDRFNIIDFDTSFEPLFDSAMPAIDINKKHGIRFAKYLSAGGGTEPLEAIEFAMESRDEDSDKYLRQIVFLTDGEVGNEEEILKSVQLKLDQDKLFTIGIGSAPNTYLMTKLADYGRGAYTFIGSLSEVEKKMVELFVKLESPALTNIGIHFPQGINADIASGAISDLYQGEVIATTFKLNAIPNSLRVSGVMGDTTLVKDIVVGDIKSNNNAISTLWARERISHLMDKYRSQYRRIDRDQVQEEITALALEHHLVSKFTSLVAVDITPTKPTDKRSVSQAVSNKTKAAKTATNSYLWILIGLIMVLFGGLSRFRSNA